MSIPVPHDESERLATLLDCQILDTPPEESFDEMVQLAADLCQTRMAAVSFLDSERQWFKARVGIGMPSTRREDSFCQHALALDGPLVVPDAQRDQRFENNVYVVGDPNIRFYAGIPLQVTQGSAVGTLCVFDPEPRSITSRQLDSLKTLARSITRELRLRRDLSQSRRHQAPEALPVAEGDLVGERWRVVRRIGEGGVGVVFEARGRQGERVALKFLQPRWLGHSELVERFAREARILAQLRSPFTSRILDVGNLTPELGGAPFLVLEYLEGSDLEQIRMVSHRVPWRLLVPWIIDVCSVLVEAHAAGVIHRDIKPANILLARDGRGHNRIKVLDFGIAKQEVPTSPSVTVTGQALGSAFYMSPEQMRADPRLDARSDVWALGVTLYEMLTGTVPFDGETHLDVCLAVMKRPPLPMRALGVDVPPALEAIVRRCLQRDCEARYPGVEALASDLRTLISSDGLLPVSDDVDPTHSARLPTRPGTLR